ncbi:MAG: phosphopantothenoylcysteine decarboxylase [Sedimentisphaerales bacterium]|nr:phosphopantothenoylcysteine decarboxylase [Sedimentisphaerales bacterium]
MRILITAGATREYIDPVRFISNASSGKMGCALAIAALNAGHKVTLITTVNRESCIVNRATIIKVETAGEMFEAVKKYFPRCDCLIMAAAVSDYMPAHPAKTKIKKTDKPLTIKLKPTIDILKWAGRHKKKNQILVGFALEDRNLRANAERKMQEKNLDMIIANTPAAVGVDKTNVQIKTTQKRWLKLPYTAKTTLAKKIIALAEKITKERQENEDS